MAAMSNIDVATPEKLQRIRLLNDHARHTFTGAAIVVTAAFTELEAATKARALSKVRTFAAFDEGNDPHHEHDMGFFEESGERFFWKFDYYAPCMKYGSDDPSNPGVTRRVLTIGLASDY
jgi:hypothetical protein